ncbi:MAG: DUF1206 domain-containing protein [Allosphingosinicella sp.]|uniref:DUF1206 domain-containing protein n=1 Tax=Allosphingosinicella sp. TaxID=2823234 RepID=UPI003958BECB
MEVRRRFETLARWGHAARGAVYLLVAWLAVRAALFNQDPGDNQTALAFVADGTTGRAMLAAIAVGLAAFGLWRGLDGLFNPQGEGRKALARRAARIASGAAHLSLAFAAARLALSGGSGGDAGARPQDESARDWTGFLLQHPLGEVAVMLAGLIVLAVGAAQWVKAWRCGFMRDLGADAPPAWWLKPAGRAGYAARGVVFAMIGLFLILAGWERDPSEAGGMGQALTTLQAQPSGPYLLGAVAVGLAMFGLFSMVQAKCRVVRSPTLA